MKLLAKTFDALSAKEVYEILKSRAEVFLLEQKIICMDADDMDYAALHCFFMENNRVIAYLRAYPVDAQTVRIGRVLTLQHGAGIGKELLAQSLPVIRRTFSCNTITIDAQTHAIGFYTRAGFQVTSGEFLEEGVPHVKMELQV